MKNLLIFFLLFPFLINAQIKKIDTDKGVLIGEVSPMNVFIASCTKYNNLYSVMFNNVKYSTITDIKSFEFSDVDNAFENFCNIIFDGLENTPKDMVVVEVGKGNLYLKFIKSFGVKSFKFYYTDKFGVVSESGWLTLKQTKKLFGKDQ